MIQPLLSAKSPFKRLRLAVAAGSMAVVGVMVVVLAHAAGPYVSIETENGAQSGSIATVSDASASGGQAVKLATTIASACPVPKRTITASDVTNNTNSGYPAGTQVYVAGGPDPWGGCFPSAANTGVPAGTVLTNYTGPCNITTANTVIDAKNIDCDIIVQANNVTIKNSKITAGFLEVRSGSLLFQDNEADWGQLLTSEGMFGRNYTALRNNIHGGHRSIYCESTCTIQDNYLHDQLSDPTGVAHESGVRVEQYTTLRHNTIWCNAPEFPPDAGCSADQTGYPDFAPVHDNTLDKNFYMAWPTQGYCSYGGATKTKTYSNDPTNATNIHSTNNVFQRGTWPNDRTTIPLSDKRRYTCGTYGVTTDYDSSRPGFIFTGNMWDDGLLFINDTTYPSGTFYD